MALLAIPATTREMQKARKTRPPRPMRAANAPIMTARSALAMVPAEDSDNDQGAAAHNEDASAAPRRTTIAPVRAHKPSDQWLSHFGARVESSRRKPPQPTSAAA